MHARAREDLDLLSTRLRRIQADYERARSRGDTERVYQFRLQMNAIVAERDRLLEHLPSGASRDMPMQVH